jgi:hypothetical protein
MAGTHNVRCPDKLFRSIKKKVLVSGAIVKALLIGMHVAEPYMVLCIDFVNNIFKLVIKPWLASQNELMRERMMQ